VLTRRGIYLTPFQTMWVLADRWSEEVLPQSIIKKEVTVRGLILLCLIFGLTLSIYIRNKEIQNDIQRIKEKLGI
jgi:hypothetical protein